MPKQESTALEITSSKGDHRSAKRIGKLVNLEVKPHNDAEYGVVTIECRGQDGAFTQTALVFNPALLEKIKAADEKASTAGRQADIHVTGVAQTVSKDGVDTTLLTIMDFTDATRYGDRPEAA